MRKFLRLGILGAVLAGSAFVRAEEAPDMRQEAGVSEEAELREDAAETETELREGGEETQPEEQVLTVGNTTPFTGAFFTRMWGNSVCDLDVQTLVHGYDLVEWRSEEGIFRIDPSVVSGIAVTENTRGDRTYTLTLYEDLFYSDGTEITASDYAFSMLFNIAPEVAEIGGSVKQAEYLLGYEDYMTGETPYLAGVRILGDHMLSITVSSEYLPFFYELALLDCTPFPISVIAPGCVVRDDGSGVYITNEDPEIEEPLFTAELLQETVLDPEEGYLSHPSVSSGPYRLLSYDGETAEFELNTYYKGNSDGIRPSIGKLIYTTSQNEDMIDELEKGSFGLLNKTVSAETVREGTQLIARSDDFAMRNYARNGLSYICFCCEKKTVADEKVRQAIALCLDKDALVEEYVSNYGLRVDGYYGIGQWMYQLLNGTITYPVDPPEDPEDAAAEADYEAELAAWEELNMDDIPRYDLDVERAVRLLEEEGYVWNPEGKAFDPEKDEVRCREEDGEYLPLELSILIPEENTVGEALEEHFAAHLAEAGAKLSIETAPTTELLSMYYGQQDRSCDMMYLATNFDLIFDPSLTFRPETETAEASDEEAGAAAASEETAEEPEEAAAVTEEPEEEAGAAEASDEAGTPEEEPDEAAEGSDEAGEKTAGHAAEYTSATFSISSDLEGREEDTGELLTHNIYNTSRISDSRLYELAVDMRRTEPGDTLAYCRKWLAFQERFAEVLPMIPVYSNVYFDFYTRRLQDYQISENVTWGQAVVYSRLTDAPDPEEETGEEAEAAENGGEASETDEEDVIEIDEENTIEIDD